MNENALADVPCTPRGTPIHQMGLLAIPEYPRQAFAPAPDTPLANIPTNDLYNQYRQFVALDPGVKEEALNAYREMRELPHDHLDKPPNSQLGEQGLVGRRAPMNPLASPKLGKYRRGQGQAKVADPALTSNPLRGRLLVTLGTSGVLLAVFVQSLVLNKHMTGQWFASSAVNGMIGPEPVYLYQLGGLNTNAMRDGEIYRLFWAMWMHSGWMHILFNVLTQMQFLYMMEPDWGYWRALFVFWISGMTGNLVSAIADPCTTTVGSSGALFGLMGAVLPYCAEYWKSIPRPCCIVFFSTLVMVVSILTGFTGSTDNWAHMGGLTGGLLFGFGTITTLSVWDEHNCTEKCCPCFLTDEQKTGPQRHILVMTGPDGKRKKKVVRRTQITRHLQKKVQPSCKCGPREWTVRLISWLLLTIIWFVCFWYLLVDWEYQPPGHVTYTKITRCCCCYDSSEEIIGNWKCFPCDFIVEGSETWEETCAAQIQRDANVTLDAIERLAERENGVFDGLDEAQILDKAHDLFRSRRGQIEYGISY